ncbi:hypothetical protein AMELA_G00167810 [Ameiurus melas]|uniref:Uncharacterized protein n=1 Tax=Ameiurus melas TaxID=219545 RepID=A0A7J6AEH4_AMEME|nr:hypothetical protein AMELA_G00167810 [Ameiurus melas]
MKTQQASDKVATDATISTLKVVTERKKEGVPVLLEDVLIDRYFQATQQLDMKFQPMGERKEHIDMILVENSLFSVDEVCVMRKKQGFIQVDAHAHIWSL